MITSAVSITKKGILKIIPIAIFISVFSFSCRITLIAPYDVNVKEQIEVVAKKVDKFYLTMLETTKEGTEREFSRYVNDYIDIEVELNSLLSKNQIRALNKESVKQCEIALETWIKYKEKHKNDNGISNGDIELNRDYLRDLFIVIQIGEEAKNKVNSKL